MAVMCFPARLTGCLEVFFKCRVCPNCCSRYWLASELFGMNILLSISGFDIEVIEWSLSCDGPFGLHCV